MSARVYMLHVPGGRGRYVGVTTQSLSQRLSGHRFEASSTDAQNRKVEWMREVGVERVCIKLLEEVEGDGLSAEAEWITRLLRSGCQLTNYKGRNEWARELCAREFAS